MYNIVWQVNLFGIVTMVAELLPSGGFWTTFRVEVANLLSFYSAAMLFQMACQFIYVLFIVVFIVKEAR